MSSSKNNKEFYSDIVEIIVNGIRPMYKSGETEMDVLEYSLSDKGFFVVAADPKGNFELALINQEENISEITKSEYEYMFGNDYPIDLSGDNVNVSVIPSDAIIDGI